MIELADVAGVAAPEVVDDRGQPLGRATAFHLSEDGRQPLFVALPLQAGGPATLVPLQGARLHDGVLHLGFGREGIESAPVVVDPSSAEERATVLDWFDGRAGGRPSGVGATPPGLTDAPGPPQGAGPAGGGAAGAGSAEDRGEH